MVKRIIKFLIIEFSNIQIQFHSFHEILQKVVKKKYQIYLPNRIFKVIRELQVTRNNIVHLGKKKTKPEFEIIENCFRVIVESLNEQVEKAIGDFQSSLNELKNKILDFDSLLDEINNSLK